VPEYDHLSIKIDTRSPEGHPMLDLNLLRSDLAAAYDLAPSLAAAEATRPIWERAARVIPFAEWAVYAPYVQQINRLKAKRDAVILGHNYMTPQVFHGVCDVVGDSLQLAMAAQNVSARVIVQGGVHFMAETSKVLNPSKTVLMPDMEAGCSLASSITAEGVAEMRRRYPGAPVVAYVNTSAEVKAAADVCCTSSNAAAIVRRLAADTVIMLPDKYLAQNVARQVPEKRVVWWDGSCIVHEQFTAADLRAFRGDHPDVRIIAHPECPPDVVDEADFTGSTAAIIDYVGRESPTEALLVTECSMASNISDAHPEVNFVGPCTMCPFMKMITLEKILWSLHTMTTPVEVPAHLAEGARAAVQRMIDLSGPR
jgi:quinolinate synthase